MSAGQIRAGQAFVEVTIKDGMAQGLRRAQAKLAGFGAAVKVMSTTAASALTGVGAGLAGIGGALAAAGGGITAIMSKSVGVFMAVSKHAKDIGMAIAGIDPSKAEKLSAAFNTLKAVFGAIQFFIGSALAGPLTQLLQLFISAGVQVAKFVRDNQQLVVAVAAVGAGLLVAGTVLAGLGAAFAIAGTALAGIVAGFAALMTPVGAAIAIIGGLVAIVVGGVAAWAAFTSSGRDAMTGIAAAIANGDIQGAFKIVLQSLATMWAEWSEFVVKAWTGASHAILDAWQTTVEGIANAILQIAKVAGSVPLFGRALKAAGLDIAGIQSQRDTLNKGLGLPPENVLNEGKDSIKNSTKAMAAPLRAFLDEMDKVATAGRVQAQGDLSNMSQLQRKQLSLRLGGIESFAGMVGGPLDSGSSAGAFGGAAGGLLGVGAGGGLKVTDDKGNALLERIIKAINGLDVAAEFG